MPCHGLAASRRVQLRYASSNTRDQGQLCACAAARRTAIMLLQGDVVDRQLAAVAALTPYVS